MRQTMGGWPPQMDVSIYAGLEYDCACGRRHCFDPLTLKVLRELPGMRLVFICPESESINCVKIRGFFRHRLESLFGVKSEADCQSN